jgi:hypothetical protein
MLFLRIIVTILIKVFKIYNVSEIIAETQENEATAIFLGLLKIMIDLVELESEGAVYREGSESELSGKWGFTSN